MMARPDQVLNWTRDDAKHAKAHHERNFRMFKRVIITLMVGSLMSAGALGCNTFRGAGKDIQKGGEAVENAAEGAQH